MCFWNYLLTFWYQGITSWYIYIYIYILYIYTYIYIFNRQNLLSMAKVICWWSLNSNEIFQISHDYEAETVHHRQNFWQKLSKSYYRYFFPIRGLQSREGWGEAWRIGGLNVLDFPSPSLSCKSWYPIKNTLRSVLGLITVMILKRVRESIFLPSNKFRASKVRDGI